MKGVILICLLSLSVCYSVAAPQDVTPPAQAVPPTPPKANEKDVEPKVPENLVPAAGTQSEIKNNTKEANGAAAAGTNKNTNLVPQSNDTKNGAPPAEKNNKNETKSDKDLPKPDEKTTEASPAKNDTTPSIPEPKPKNDTNTDNKETKTVVTTPKSEVVAPTEAPKVQASRAFDGPSFIGGIILTLGLLAIGFMGFKYYKNQTERNYHTL